MIINPVPFLIFTHIVSGAGVLLLFFPLYFIHGKTNRFKKFGYIYGGLLYVSCITAIFIVLFRWIPHQDFTSEFQYPENIKWPFSETMGLYNCFLALFLFRQSIKTIRGEIVVNYLAWTFFIFISGAVTIWVTLREGLFSPVGPLYNTFSLLFILLSLVKNKRQTSHWTMMLHTGWISYNSFFAGAASAYFPGWLRMTEQNKFFYPGFLGFIFFLFSFLFFEQDSLRRYLKRKESF